MDEEGKINWCYSVLSDALAFLSCNMNLCTKDTFIDAMSAYYGFEDLLYLKLDGHESFRETPKEVGCS